MAAETEAGHAAAGEKFEKREFPSARHGESLQWPGAGRRRCFPCVLSKFQRFVRRRRVDRASKYGEGSRLVISMAPPRMTLRKVDTALLAAGAAAAILAVAAFAAEPLERLEDVQIGERGNILRVALICSTTCDVAPAAGIDFRLNGVRAELDTDLTRRSALAERLTISPEDGASLIRLKTAERVNAARVITCRSDTGPAPCIEFRFDHPAGEPAPTKPAATKPTAPQKEIPFIGAVILAPRPGLRDEPAKGLIYLPDFSPPERLQSPQSSLTAPPEEKIAEARRPALVAIDRARALSEGGAFDIKREANEILGKSFSVGACEGAKARLQGDAWALNAMIDLAFCKAGEGKLAEADADFSRLLAYTPDNYEALVGRALIAIASGEPAKGKGFYQEALNALPPIAESDRIVAAMDRI